MYKFRRKGEQPPSDPKPEPQVEAPPPFPENEGALTVEEFYAQNDPPLKRDEISVREWDADENAYVWVTWPVGVRSRWSGWRFAQGSPEYVFKVPVLVDTRQPVAQMRDAL